MIKPKTYSINNNKQLPVYDSNDIVKFDPDNIDNWFNRDDIIILDFSQLLVNDVSVELEFKYLNDVLNEINIIEEQFKIK